MQKEGIVIRLIYFNKLLFIIVVIFLSLMQSCCQIEESYYFEDDEGVGWINCGEGPSWHLDADQYHNGTQSMKSGDIECNGVSTLCRKIQGPASIEFWWKWIPIPNEGSQLSFYIDDKKERSWNSEWRKEPPISLRDNKSYIAKWELVKKDCPPGTKGFAWIDDIKIKYHDSPDYVSPLPRPVYPIVTNPITNKTVYVSQKSQGPQPFFYKSINEAIKHVVPGGIVKIDEGFYEEQVIISFPLLLIGGHG